jgi:hypothetical protein
MASHWSRRSRARGPFGHESDSSYRWIGLEPASPAVPTATEKDHHEEDDDQKRRVVHVGLLVAER